MHWTSDFHCVCIDVPVCFSFYQQVCLLHLWYSISTFPKQENETMRQKEWEFLWKNKKKVSCYYFKCKHAWNTHGPTYASAMTNTICTVLRCLSDLHSEYQFASMGKLYNALFRLHPLTHLFNSLSLSLLWFYHFAWRHGRCVRKRSRVHFIIITKCSSAKTLDEKVIISFYYYYCHSCCLAWLCSGIRVSYFSHTCETI